MAFIMSTPPQIEEVSDGSDDSFAQHSLSGEEHMSAEEQKHLPAEAGVEDSIAPPVEIVEQKRLEKWPLDSTEIYSLSAASKRKVFERLQSKLAFEKSLPKPATDMQSYDQALHEINTVERRSFADRVQRLKNKYKTVFKKPLQRRIPGEEPGYIRVFKYYIDSIQSGLRPTRPSN